MLAEISQPREFKTEKTRPVFGGSGRPEAEPLPLVIPTKRYRCGDKGFEGQVARLPTFQDRLDNIGGEESQGKKFTYIAFRNVDFPRQGAD